MVVSHPVHGQKATDLSVGRALPIVAFTLDEALIRSYIESVEDETGSYEQKNLVPPLAIAAIAKKKLMEVLHIPDGAIQSLAIFDFWSLVRLGEMLKCRGDISEHWIRNNVNYVAVDIQINSINRRRVLSGTMGFILAPSIERGVRA
jgi:hypothetical protein